MSDRNGRPDPARYDHEFYVPRGAGAAAISWDAQMDKAARMMAEGRTVIVHAHGYGGFCKEPWEGGEIRGCVHNVDSATLVPVNEAPSNEEASVSPVDS